MTYADKAGGYNNEHQYWWLCNVEINQDVYKVVGVKDDSFLLTLSIFHDDAFWFDNRCIKDVYNVTKINKIG